MGAVTAAWGCVAASAVCASAWTPGAIPASAQMQDASAWQRQARRVAGTKRIAILLLQVNYTNSPERRPWSADRRSLTTSYHISFGSRYYPRCAGRFLARRRWPTAENARDEIS